MLTIAPPRARFSAPPRAANCRTMCGSAALVARNMLLRLTRTTRSQSASLISSGPPTSTMPTLLCSTSSAPKRARQVSTIAATSAVRDTSPAKTSHVPPSPATIARVSSAASRRRSTASTFAPSRANSAAVALPLPQPGPDEPAPVTIAARPSSRPPMSASRALARPAGAREDDPAMREKVKVWAPILALIVAGFVFTGRFVSPLPPRELTIAGGAEGGAYDRFAERYRDAMAREGITLKILRTRGALENLELLGASPRKVDAALVQGGVANEADYPMVESLGTMFFEPVFLFARRGDGTDKLRDLASRKVAIGAEGSGTRVLALKLLTANGFDPRAPGLLPLGGADARDALLRGEIDAAIFVLAYPLPSLEPLFRAPEIRLISFERLEAYRMWFPYLSAVSLPAGSVRP